MFLNKNIRFGGKNMTELRIQKLESLFKTGEPIVRTTVLRSGGFCSKDIEELVQCGQLHQVRRGYYMLAYQTDTLNGFAVLASLVPEGIISLFSAAQYHDLSTVIPQSIEITLPSVMRTPVLPETLHVTVQPVKNAAMHNEIEAIQKTIDFFITCDIVYREIRSKLWSIGLNNKREI
jgi:hypothetical protein